MILVVGHEKLNAEMQRTYGNRITVVKIPKSGGVSGIPVLVCSSELTIEQAVEPDALYRSRVHKYRMHSYFYGERFTPPPGMPSLASALAATSYLIAGEQPTDFTLAPASSVVNFGDISIWRIGEGQLLFYSQGCSLLK